jgi:hypothetical protein
MRCLKKQQDRCHGHLASESIKNSRKSHGFEFRRTVSYNHRAWRRPQKTTKNTKSLVPPGLNPSKRRAAVSLFQSRC